MLSTNEIIGLLAIIVVLILAISILYIGTKVIEQLKKTNISLIKTINSTNNAVRASEKTLNATTKVLNDVDNDNKKIQPTLQAIIKLSNDISNINDKITASSKVLSDKSKNWWKKLKNKIKK